VKEDAELDAKVDPGIVVAVASWLERYDLMLEWTDRALENTADMDGDLEKKVHFASQRAVALSRLGRANESQAALDQLQKLSSEFGSGVVTYRMGNLYKLQEFEEVLEAARSDLHDGNPRVWFWRSLAHARLGNVKEAKEAYSEYEAKIGTDIIGQKKFSEALPAEEQKEEPI
jgi:tetratricopeptide (TPR) repeat protein